MNATEPFVDITALSSFLDSIGSFNVDLIFTPQTKLREGSLQLYHYTDLGGLIGIVEKHDLWLTHSRYSNDEEEMRTGLRVVEEVIDQAVHSGTYDPIYLQELQRITSSPEGVYICCFCEEENLLSQWRAYGASGSGVSLQFAPKQFADISGPDNINGLLRFWKVFYRADTQRDIIQKALLFYAPQGAQLDPAERARKAADAIRFFIPTFKNQDFEEEKEWRLIFTPSPQATIPPRFRVGRNMLVPYYSLRDLIS